MDDVDKSHDDPNEPLSKEGLCGDFDKIPVKTTLKIFGYLTIWDRLILRQTNSIIRKAASGYKTSFSEIEVSFRHRKIVLRFERAVNDVTYIVYNRRKDGVSIKLTSDKIQGAQIDRFFYEMQQYVIEMADGEAVVLPAGGDGLKFINGDYFEIAKRDFKTILEANKIEADSVYFSCAIQDFSVGQRIIDFLKALPEKSLKVKTFFTSPGFLLRHVPLVLNVTQPNHLKRIEVMGQFPDNLKITTSSFNTILNSEYWPALNRFEVNNSQSQPLPGLDAFHHLDTFVIGNVTASEEELVRLKDVILASPTFKLGRIIKFTTPDGRQLFFRDLLKLVGTGFVKDENRYKEYVYSLPDWDYEIRFCRKREYLNMACLFERTPKNVVKVHYQRPYSGWDDLFK